MGIFRSNINYAIQIFQARLGDPYVYGGAFDPDPADGCDCSGLVTTILSALFNGAAGMVWGRQGLSTESYRYRPLGPQNVGPFPLVHVADLSDIPADAVAIIDLHHEGAGGPDSHMNILLTGTYMEESGSYGCCTAGRAIPDDSSYWNDHWYVAGPIEEDGWDAVYNEIMGSN